MLTIGIINNMAIAAVQSVDRQFTEILTSAAAGIPLRIRWFRLSGARPAHYESLDALWESRFDGVIVTGAEPRSLNLREEPFWQPLATTVDWASRNTHSTIWSCLATHAAVLHLDNVDRVRQPEKTFGVFPSYRVDQHPMLMDFSGVWKVPHSRWHDLPRDRLETCGYQVYAHSPDCGVDMFAKQVARSLFWFVQSHPEYDAGALMREYRRDIARFQVGHVALQPRQPKNYFDTKTAAALAAVSHDAARQTEILDRVIIEGSWQPVAITLYRNWLRYLETCRSMAEVT